MPPQVEVGSPGWWVTRLSKEMRARRASLQLARDYYDGKHNLAFATEKFLEVFGGLFREFSDNWCAPVVQAPAERLKVRGIRTGESEAGRTDPGDNDKEAWAIWQRNELDAESQKHHTEVLSTGYGAALVWATDEGQAEITIEDPLQMIVGYDPERPRRRAAALKRWVDDWTGYEHATLYLPDGLYKFRSETKPAGELTEVDLSNITETRWVKREVTDEAWPLPNPLKVVPVVEFANDPTIKGAGRSEIRQVIPVQNAVNKFITDMLLASESVAWPWRYIVGWTPENDPDTGEPMDAEVRSVLTRLMTFEGENVKPGQFDQASIEGHIRAVEMLVHHIAARTRTPRHYLIQMGQSPSGDAIKSAESGLVAKVGERQVTYGERWEEVIRLALAAEGEERPGDTSSELVWGDPEFRTEGELTDAIIKQFQAGLIPWRTAVQRLGYSPQEIERMDGERMQDTLTGAGLQLNDLIEELAT